MDFSAHQWFRLNLAASLGVLAFVVLYLAPVTLIVPALIVMIPFPILHTSYGTFTVYLVYLVALVLALRGQFRALPYFAYVCFIAFAYAVSLSDVPPPTLREHFLYLIFIGSNFLLFYIVYNYYRYVGDAQGFFNLFVFVNVLVLLYSVVQMVLGTDSTVYADFGLKTPRDDGRLTGPFGTVGLTAEYLVMAVLICSYILLKGSHKAVMRLGLVLMIFGNIAAMIATANRGAVFSLVAGGLAFVFLFRKELGTRGVILVLGGVPFVFAIAAAVVINFTDFNRLFERLADTEIEEGIPDTRSVVWPATWELIQQRPIAGHGPELRFKEETHAKRGVPEAVYWPHNLYLYIAYTLGIIGLAAYLAFWGRLCLQFYTSMRYEEGGSLAEGVPRLALVLMAVFFIDQIKVEFLRSHATEFMHFLFMLWGALAALSERNRIRGLQSDRTAESRRDHTLSQTVLHWHGGSRDSPLASVNGKRNRSSGGEPSRIQPLPWARRDKDRDGIG
jgi:O-antigen ligase